MEDTMTTDELMDLDEMDRDWAAACPACGSIIDFCQGHGEIGDPFGALVLRQHDNGNHSQCHPGGCDEI